MTEPQNTKCKHCGCDEFVEELTPEGPHYGKSVCVYCSNFSSWLPKPDKPKSKRSASHKQLVKKYGRGFCEMCLLAFDELPNNCTLEGHHIIPYKKDGDSNKENIWIVCKSCHKLIHWTRTYHGTNDRIPD